MKFGVADHGVDVWDGGLYNMEKRLVDMKRIGFSGIERLEADNPFEAVAKAALYRKMGMQFTTCRSPKASTGLEIAAALGVTYVWFEVGQHDRKIDFNVYCRRCNAYSEAAMAYGLKAALHNHLGSRVENQDELDEFMKICPNAGLVLDIGHLQAAGGDPIRTVEKYAGRIVAMHFKDVQVFDETVGLERYGERLRFCGLGEGNINIDFKGIADSLKKIGYSDWVFVEHDHHTADPRTQLPHDLQLLKNIF